MRMPAASPNFVFELPNLCIPSFVRPMTVASASIGSPEAGDVLPPKRSGSVDRRIRHATLEQAADDVGVVGRRTTASIIGWVGHNNWPLRLRIGGSNRFIVRQILGVPGAALLTDLRA